MDTQKSSSLQAILKRRQQEAFVGREEQINSFRRNLSLDPNDDQRLFIFNIFGQGGIGKTSLLRRFRQYANESQFATVWSDENEDDVPMTMAYIAEQFETHDQAFKLFSERYHTYRQRRQELESDPEAPQGSPAFVGRILAKTGVHLGRRIPGAGAILDCVDEDAFANQVSEWATYITRKLKNKDEIHLVQEPVEVLTPLFLQGLRKIAEKHSIALFFDTYEKSGEYLDEWLRNLLEGHYGDISPNIVLVIAGRDELDRNKWAAYKDLLLRLPMEPFSEQEARLYLARKGIVDERIVEVILHLSGRLPLLVATLAAESPRDPNQVGDPSGTAVDRFLKWVEDPKQRQLAIDAALPRQFNRDILTELVGEPDCDALFTWLKQMPFVEKQARGWVYHEVVRTQMLRYKQQETPLGWTALHHKLMQYYERQKEDLGLSKKQKQRNEAWQNYITELLYHQLCAETNKHLPEVIGSFIEAFATDRAFALRQSEIILQAGKDTLNSDMQLLGKILTEGMEAYDAKKYAAATKLFTALLDNTQANTYEYIKALEWRGRLYLWADNYTQALPDLTKTTKLVPKEARVRVDLGYTYYAMKQYESSLVELNHALALKPDYLRAIILRGRIYEGLGRYEDALADLTHAIELRPLDAHPLIHRGEIYSNLMNYNAALDDLNQAIALEPSNTSLFSIRGLIQLKMHHYDKAQVDFTKVIDSNPNSVSAIANRALIYKQIGNYEEALKGFERAIELNPSIEHQAKRDKGETLQLMGRYQEAAQTFIEALNCMPACTHCWTKLAETYNVLYSDADIPSLLRNTVVLDNDVKLVIFCRTKAMRDLGYYEEAVAEFEKLIVSDNVDIEKVGNELGLTLTYLGRYTEAIEIYERLLEKDPSKSYLLYNIAVTMFRSKGLPDAQEHITRAHIALMALPDTSNSKGSKFYGLGGLKALTGDTQQALDYLQQAIQFEKEAILWARYDIAWLDLRKNSRYQMIIS